MRHFTITLLLCVNLGCWFATHAQTSNTNPFELEHRVQAALAEMATTGQTSSEVAVAINPFDVVPHVVPAAELKEPEKLARGSMDKIHLRPQAHTQRKFVLMLLASTLIFLALTFAIRRGVVMKTWQAFFSNNFLISAQRDYSGMIGAAPFYLLYVHFFANLGLFFFMSLVAFTGDRFNHLGSLMLCIGLSIALFLLKHLTVAVLGWLSGMQSEAEQYNFMMLVFCCVSGLFLLPANFFLAFKSSTASFLPFWIAAVLVVFYLFWWLRSFGVFGRVAAKNLFHFLLYICIVEFIPLAVLFKFALNHIA